MSLQDQLNQLDNKKCLIISLVIAGFYYFFFFDENQGIKSQIKVSHDNLAKKQGELDKIDVSIKNKEKFELENKELFENMKDFEHYLNPNLPNDVLLEKVSNYAKTSDVIVNNLEFDKPHEEFSDYPGKVVFVNVSSQYHNLMGFISKLTQMERVIDFENMSLKVENKGDVPIVNLEMNLIVYSVKQTNETESDSREENKDEG